MEKDSWIRRLVSEMLEMQTQAPGQVCGKHFNKFLPFPSVTMCSSIYKQGDMFCHPQESLKLDIVSNPRCTIGKVYLPMAN